VVERIDESAEFVKLTPVAWFGLLDELTTKYLSTLDSCVNM
jgi:hypothetical protein